MGVYIGKYKYRGVPNKWQVVKPLEPSSSIHFKMMNYEKTLESTLLLVVKRNARIQQHLLTVM